MTDGTVREQVLANRLAAIHDQWAATTELLEAEYQAGKLAKSLAAEQMELATAIYDRDRALAQLAADTGWETWAGVAALLYARRPRSSPPKVVRGTDVAELRKAIEEAGSPEQPGL